MAKTAAMLAMMWLSFAANAADYHIGAGDTLSVHVHNEADLSRPIVVPENCELQMGLVGAVKACGLTMAEVAADIQLKLADGYLVNPQVTVEVSQYGSQLVQVMGEVKTPGEIILDGPKTLLEVILEAGDRKSENVVDVELVRGGEIRLFNIEQLPSQEAIYVIAGDVVVVKQPRFVYVGGGVKKDGPVDYRDGLTVSQALTYAGGQTEYARLRQATITRGEERIQVNLRRIIEGKDADVELKPEDRVYIPGQ